MMNAWTLQLTSHQEQEDSPNPRALAQKEGLGEKWEKGLG